jgi:rare lipoprotein A
MMKSLAIFFCLALSLLGMYPSRAQQQTDTIPLSADTIPFKMDTLPPADKDTAIHPLSSPDTVAVGIASYYADRFEGRRTSSGEIFRQSRMTAAHNSLPLGSWIRVTRLDNGRQVVVRINDRMHPLNKRLVDLSKAAAKKLGYVGAGLVMVRIENLGMSPPPDQ